VREGAQHGCCYDCLQRDRHGIAGQNPAVDGAVRLARRPDWHWPRKTVCRLPVGRIGVLHRVWPNGNVGEQPAGVRVSHLRHH